MGNQYPTVPRYDSPEWKALRTEHLRLHPHCVMCIQAGKPRRGFLVDHKIPHRGNYLLWRDPENLQTLCRIHGNATKQKAEVSGQEPGCGLTGWPTDENHYWNSGNAKQPKRVTQQQVGETKKGRKP